MAYPTTDQAIEPQKIASRHAYVRMVEALQSIGVSDDGLAIARGRVPS